MHLFHLIQVLHQTILPGRIHCLVLSTHPPNPLSRCVLFIWYKIVEHTRFHKAGCNLWRKGHGYQIAQQARNPVSTEMIGMVAKARHLSNHIEPVYLVIHRTRFQSSNVDDERPYGVLALNSCFHITRIRACGHDVNGKLATMVSASSRL